MQNVTLRTILCFIFVLLSLMTVGGVGWIACVFSFESLTKVTAEEFYLKNQEIGRQVVLVLDGPAQQLLTELPKRAEHGLLPIKDPHDLALELGESFRSYPRLAWLCYSTNAGFFMAARRDSQFPGTVFIQSSEVHKTPVLQELKDDDSLVPSKLGARLAEIKQDYDPRSRDWYKAASTNSDIQWSGFYNFVDGTPGITASRSWRLPNSGDLGGVFTVDFVLEGLHELLGELARTNGDYVAVLKPNGDVVVASSDDTELAAALKKETTRLQGKVSDSFKTGEALITASGRTCLVAFQSYTRPFPFLVVTVAPSSVVYREAYRTAWWIAGIGFSGLLIAFIIGLRLAAQIAEPLRLLSVELKSVGEFNLDSRSTQPGLIHELTVVNEASERMKSGLRSFNRYVPSDLVRQLLRSGKEAVLGGEIKELTIFISDIEGFTTYSEKVRPDKLMTELAVYFELMTAKISKHQGTLDKYLGDGILAFFNAPFPLPNHCQAASLASLECLELLNLSKSPFRTRIGLHCGDVLVGNIGTRDRFAYTVLGDTVNTTSRLEGLNKLYGTRIIASQTVQGKTSGDLEWRFLDRVAVAGRSAPLGVYELLGTTRTTSERILRARTLYEKALVDYFRRDFKRARDQFIEAGILRGTDPAATVMADRCESLTQEKPGSDWNGTFVHTSK